MPRIAVGDLLIDLYLPDDYACEYCLSGSLLAHDDARGIELEISTITMEGKAPDASDLGIRHVLRSAKSKRHTLVLEQDDLVITREDCNWYAGFGNRVVVLTLSFDGEEPSESEVVKILSSVAPAHAPLLPVTNGIAITSLSQSHALWFRQRREALREDVGWHADGPIPVESLEAFWEKLVTAPDDHADLVATKLSAFAVSFGDHLVSHGFDWCIAADQWGTGFAVVALPETAKFTVMPDSFIAKRWERKERRFLADAFKGILKHLEEFRTSWAKSAH